jgi:hypothetical protein
MKSNQMMSGIIHLSLTLNLFLKERQQEYAAVRMFSEEIIV